MHDGYFAQELMLGGDDDADGIAGDVRTPGGEALEGDEVAGLDEGGEGALLVDTPEIDVTGTPITGPGPNDRFLISTTMKVNLRAGFQSF